MDKLLSPIIDFLFTDVKNKKETKELAVLIRFNCIMFGIYYLIIGIIIAFYQHYFLSLALIGAIGILAGAFICTYENHTILGLTLLNTVIIAFSTFLTFFVGYDLDFHFPIFLTILLLYYNKSEHMVSKRFFTISICLFMMVFAQFCDALSSANLDSGFPTILVRSVNMILITCTVGVLAYSYCMKFNEAEDKLRKINDNLEKMANIDTLTGLSNRRHMNEYLSDLVSDFNKTGKSYTIAIGDVDFFKKVNDTYGHDTGDYVLSTLADMFKEHMKGRGKVARWGGEEFLFVFENADIKKAYLILDELRHKIEIKDLAFKEYFFKVTMSYGMEEYNDRLGTEMTISRADQKLYKAKTTGRNKVIM